MLYGVQYRNMHTATHHVSIHATPKGAKDVLCYIDQNERMPPQYMQSAITIAINPRDVPAEYEGESLVLVNYDREPIPGCY